MRTYHQQQQDIFAYKVSWVAIGNKNVHLWGLGRDDLSLETILAEVHLYWREYNIVKRFKTNESKALLRKWQTTKYNYLFLAALDKETRQTWAPSVLSMDTVGTLPRTWAWMLLQFTISNVDKQPSKTTAHPDININQATFV